MSRRFGRRSLSNKRRFAILQRDAFTCQYCGRSAPEVALEVDHVIPLLVGGTDHPSNLVTACKDCNGSKSDKLDVVRHRWTAEQYDEMFSALGREILACRQAQRELARERCERFSDGTVVDSLPGWATVRPTVLALSGFAAFLFPSAEHGEVLKQILACTESAEAGSPAHLSMGVLAVDVTVGAYMQVVKARLTRSEQLDLAELIVKRVRQRAEEEGRPWP